MKLSPQEFDVIMGILNNRNPSVVYTGNGEYDDVDIDVMLRDLKEEDGKIYLCTKYVYKKDYLNVEVEGREVTINDDSLIPEPDSYVQLITRKSLDKKAKSGVPEILDMPDEFYDEDFPL